MLNLVRGTSKFVTVESQDISGLIDFIKTSQTVIRHGNYNKVLINEIFEKAVEGNTVIFLTDKIKERVQEKDILYLFLIENELECFLADIHNKHLSIPIITKIKISPRIILLRTAGNVEKVIEQVTTDINGCILPRDNAIDNISEGTLIYFACDALHKPNQLKTTYPKCVHTLNSYYSVFRYLRNQNLKYLNIGIDNNDWYELKIKIYDAYGYFDLHYERMRYIFEKLEIGMILGETWGKDIASAFQTVGIYKVRFFTFNDPLVIKKILVGLEYLEDGERICDYDLYWKRKKYHWDQTRTDALKGKGKRELGVYYREEILNQLSPEEIDQMISMETKIRATKE